MIFSLKHTGNGFAGKRRLLVAITVWLIFYSLLAEAACDNEVNNANQVAQRIAREWPLRFYLDNKTQYVQKMADSLVHAVKSRIHGRYFDWPSHAWRFMLVRDLSVNAYSIGNGRVYLTDGTFDFVKNEAELAAIIAHELAHQLLGHFCSLDSDPSENRIGSFVQVIDNNKEMEADALAIEILHKANFPPRAMYDIVKRLPASSQDSVYKQTRLNALKHQLKGIKNIPFLSSPQFLRIKKQ